MKKLYLFNLLFFCYVTLFGQTINEQVIGTTYYRLQTTGSPYNSIVINNDETISAVWNFSPDSIQTPIIYPNRGTGYNYYDLSAWSPFPTQRIETRRTGFPNIGVTGSGAELVINHLSTALNIEKRVTKGTGVWANSIFPQTNNTNYTWTRMAIGGVSNQSVHVICQGTGVSGIPLHGQDGPLLYSRSDDEGDTWTINNVVIPLIDSSNYLGFGGNDYAIDAKGNVIAIAVGSITTDLILLKSTDNGNSWTKKIVEQFPVPFYSLNSILDIDQDGISDTLNSHRGDLDVAIDPIDSSVHIVFKKYKFYADGSTPGSFNYFPLSDSLYYWNDRDFLPNISQLVTGPMDANSNGIVDWNSNIPGAVLSCPAISIFNHAPVIFFLSIDESTNTSGQTRKHLFYTYKYPQVWSTPTIIPFTALPNGWNNNNTEVSYVSVSNQLNTNCEIAFEYLRDTLYSSATSIMQAEVVVDKIDLCPLINNVVENLSEPTFNIFPNPASDQVTINSVANGVLSIYSTEGKKVRSLIVNSNQQIELSDFKNGSYFVKYQTDKGSVVKKLIIIR